MSNREMVISIVNQIPEYKLPYVIDILNGIKNMIADVEEVEPDELDLKMIAEAEAENDGTTITLEELAKDLELNV